MFKTPSKNSAMDSAVTIGSAVAGGMMSNAAVSVIPVEDKHKKLVRGGLALVSAGGAAAVQGKSSTAKALKAVFIGMSIAQALQLVKEVADESGVATPKDAANPTSSEKLVAAVFGLACPCDGTENQKSDFLVRLPQQLNMAAMDIDKGISSFEDIAAQPRVTGTFD